MVEMSQAHIWRTGGNTRPPAFARQMKITITSLALILTVYVGCKSPPSQNSGCNWEANIKAARQIAVGAGLHIANGENEYPKSIDEMVKLQLIRSVPLCKCADGKERGFSYISGYEAGEAETSVIAVAPPEMHPDFGMTVHLNGTVEIMSVDGAQRAKRRWDEYVAEKHDRK